MPQPELTVKLMRQRSDRPILRRFRMLLVSTFSLLFGWLLYLTYSIVWFSERTEQHQADAAIVPGAAVWTARPSPVFTERIRHAVNLYRAGKVRVIILTGGKSDGDKLAESEAAREFCLSEGIPASDIHIETRSHSTLENLLEAQRIIRQQRLNSVLIVSDPLHMRRTMTMARDLGLNAWSSPTPTSRYHSFSSKLNFLLRETFFYANYLISRPFGRRTL